MKEGNLSVNYFGQSYYECLTTSSQVLKCETGQRLKCLLLLVLSSLFLYFPLLFLSVLYASNRLNQLQKATVADVEQLAHIVHLDLRDTGLDELDVSSLCKLELLRCDRNTLALLRVCGHALKSLHAAHNSTTT